MKKTFIIGSSGFVAKRHMDCLFALKQKVVALCDKKTDGYSDRYFPSAKFFLKEQKFKKFIKNNKGKKQLIICSPNYLHTRHILMGIESGCDVLCEKPPCLKEKDLDKIMRWEKKFKKKCFFVFQLRYDKSVMDIKKLCKNNKFQNAKIEYITHRGEWYKKSWKGNETKSGGLVFNIGIHLIDLLIYWFGQIEKIKVIKKNKQLLNAQLKFKNSSANIRVSTDKKYIPKKLNIKSFQYRNFKIGSKKIEFSSNFNSLHSQVYKDFLKSKGIRAEKLKYLINTLNKF